MDNTGNQIAKVIAVPAIALTGTGFFGTLIAGAIIVVGVTGVTLLVSDLAVEFFRKRRKITIEKV